MRTTTMKSFWGVMLLMFIYSNLSAQNQGSNGKNLVYSMLNGAFLKSKVTAHMPLVMPRTETTSPYFKAKQTEPVKYQLDSSTRKVLIANAELSNAVIEFKYDSLGRILLMQENDSDQTSGKYEISHKSTYVYGDKFKIVSNYYYTNATLNFDRNKTTYDNLGKVISVKSGSDSLNFETNGTLEEYVYENNKLTSKISYQTDRVTVSSKIDLYYDSEGRDTCEVTNTVDYYSGTLKPSKKNVYGYDQNGNIINSAYLNFTTYNSWVMLDYYSYGYDEKMNCILETDYSGTNITDNISSKTTYEYNNILYANTVSGDMFTDCGFMFKNQMTTGLMSVINGTVSLATVQLTFHYSERKTSTDITNTLQDNHQIVKYNAASKTISLQNAESGNSNQLQLYSLSGKLMLNKPISTSNSVSVEKLGNGLYVYKLITAGKTVVGKILVQ